METGPSILQRISQQVSQMSPSQRRIADVILNDPETAAFYTVAELAKQSQVSEATVTRFAVFVGCSGFPALTRELQEIVRTKLTTGERFRLSKTTSKTIENDQHRAALQFIEEDLQNLLMMRERIDLNAFERTVDRLANAKRIGIVSTRSAESLGLFFEFYLQLLEREVTVFTGDPRKLDHLHRFGADDLFIGIGFARYSQFTIDLLEYGKRQGTPVVAITDYPSSPLAELADEVLLTPASIASHMDSFVAPFSLITALLRSLSNRDPERVTDTLRDMEDMWSEFGIYKETKKR